MPLGSRAPRKGPSPAPVPAHDAAAMKLFGLEASLDGARRLARELGLEAAAALGQGAFASIVVTDTVADLCERGEAFASKLVVLESAKRLALALR